MESLVISLIFLCVRDITLFCKGTELINLPPVITSEFEPEYFVQISHSTPLSLFCQAKYNVLRYHWHKNYSKIVKNDRVSFNQSTGEINFKNLEKEDFGVYYCTAHNTFGISVSLFVKLLQADLDQSSPISNVQRSCREYHHCKLPCLNQPRCQPKIKCMIEWKYGSGTSKSVLYNESVTLDREGHLHFLNISKSAGNKNYTCGMWNERINLYRMVSITYLKINESSESILPAAVYQSGDNVFVGENATLLCIFSGNPVPKIEWQNKNRTNITTNHKYIVDQYGRQLHIINVTFADEGVYECKTKTNSNLTQNPFLNVTSPPIFPHVGKRFMTKILQNLTKESTVLHCNAMSATAEIDPIVLKWMKNGEILNEDVRYQLSKDKKTLHIYNFNSDDYGCYTCVVENSEGIAVANFLLPYASSDNHLSTGVLRSVLIAIAAFVGILLLGVTAIFIYKRIFIPTKNKDLAVRFKLHRTSNLYLQHDSTGPITEEPEYSYVEIQTERTDIDSVENKTQIQDVDVCTENNYSILGKCSTSPLDFTESNLYDHSENVSGIYSRTYKRRDDNQMIDSE